MLRAGLIFHVYTAVHVVVSIAAVFHTTHLSPTLTEIQYFEQCHYKHPTLTEIQYFEHSVRTKIRNI